MNSFRAFMDWGRSDSDNDDNESCTMQGPAEQRSQSSCSSSLFSGVEFASSSDEEEDNDNNHRGRLFSDEDWFSEDALHGVDHVSEHNDNRLQDFPCSTSRCQSRDDVEVVFSQQQQEPSTSLRNQTNEQHITRDRRIVYEPEALDEEMDLELVYDASDETLGADELTVHSSFDSPTPCRCASPIRPKMKKKKRHNDSLEHYSKCIHCWGHGVVTTLLTVALAWAGCALAVLARRGTDFLVLRDPLYISAMYNPVDQVGLLRMQLCYNETYDEHLYGCQTIPISASTADDIMMTLARLCIASSAVCGAFFTIFLTTAVVWESIRMKPIGFGLLMTYFLQSFTMLAFDSNVCDAHQCWIGRGCYYCIGASLCWLGACIGAAKMDTQKWQQRRERRRMFHRLARAAKEAQLAEIDGCNGANVTAGTATSSDTSSSEDDDLDPELCIF
ncbi:hypothetical protein MPSEU_000163300 [Mayamaea pseudoterrestris]|nr:hypothetical protein MPSEU_000163300 [Mayamaea pseudoterrestris]